MNCEHMTVHSTVMDSEHPDSSHLKAKSLGHNLLLSHDEAGLELQPSMQVKSLSL